MSGAAMLMQLTTRTNVLTPFCSVSTRSTNTAARTYGAGTRGLLRRQAALSTARRARSQAQDLRRLVEAMGLEPTNLLTASQALYQLSYAPSGGSPR